MSEKVKHPSHYGGQNNPYEAIKVIEAWGLNFKLGNVVKYIARAGKKDEILQELKKAQWYLEREIAILERNNPVVKDNLTTEMGDLKKEDFINI